jgi:hypothetical protein
MDVNQAATPRQVMNCEYFATRLFWGNYLSYTNSGILILPAGNNLRRVALPLQTSYLFQPLDLVTFTILEHDKSAIHVRLPELSQVWQIRRFVKALQRAAYCHNNREAWNRTGLAAISSVFPLIARGQSGEIVARNDESVLLQLFPSIGTDELPDQPW